MKHILILTGPEDFHAFAIREALVAKGADVTLWQTPDFPSKSGESVLFEGGARTVIARGPELDLDNPCFHTVWRRRPSYAIDWSKIHPSDRRFVEFECNIFRRSMLGLISPDAFWVNPPDAAISAGYKMLQHGVASALGIASWPRRSRPRRPSTESSTGGEPRRKSSPAPSSCRPISQTCAYA